MQHIAKFATGLAAALVIAAPFAAGALTINDVQGQIAALMKQVSTLQDRIKVLQSSTSSSGISPAPATASSPVMHRICSLLERNLSVGSRGDDVNGLQEFLQSEGYLSVSPTGFYGPVTAKAVARWQTAQGVSAAGFFGPISREKMKIRCGISVDTERFSVSPTSGSAPLTVTFSTWLSGFRINTISYMIDYGDGTSEKAADCNAPADACISPGQNTHVYTANGTYTATLNKITNPCAGQEFYCKAAIHSEIVAKEQITVGVQTGGKFSADPSTGAAPLSVGFTYQPSEESGQYYIDYGDGSGEQMSYQQIYCIRAPCISPFVGKHVYKNAGTYTASVSRYIACLYSNPRCMMMQPAPLATMQITVTGVSADPASDLSCKTWFDGCNTCSRTSPGSPAACTLMYCYAPAAAYCKAYFDDSTNKAPTISGFSGPTTLAVNTPGTWTINASDPEGGTLSYQIWWGDENVYAPIMNATGAARDFVQSTTFTHAYANAGTYTVSIVVQDSAGQQAKTSSTVKVGSDSVACTMDFSPVCGRPSGCMNTCPAGQYCALMCQLHPAQTYSNRCVMNAAGADFLYAGQCDGRIAY